MWEQKCVLHKFFSWIFIPLCFTKGNLRILDVPVKHDRAHISSRKIHEKFCMSMILVPSYFRDPKEHVRYSYHVSMTSRSHCRSDQNIFSKLQKVNFLRWISKDFLEIHQKSSLRTLIQKIGKKDKNVQLSKYHRDRNIHHNYMIWVFKSCLTFRRIRRKKN